jgi:hypothetical protein
MNHQSLYQYHDVLRHCIIRKKVGYSTALELYDEKTNDFLLSSIYCTSMSPMIIFVKMQDAHSRQFDELCCNINLRQFIGKMIPDWVSGCHFKLTTFQGNTVCETRIKHQILASAPVAFTATIVDEDNEEGENSINSDQELKKMDSQSVQTSRGPSSNSMFPMFDIFGCVAPCTSDLSHTTNQTSEFSMNGIPAPMKAETTGDTPSCTSNSQYVEISKNLHDLSYHRIESKPPKWNTELRQYTQNYGGRVKVPSQKNFVAVYVGPTGKFDEFYASAAHEQDSEVCIRHGKVTPNTFILDFKFPISPFVALAIASSVHVCHS